MKYKDEDNVFSTYPYARLRKIPRFMRTFPPTNRYLTEEDKLRYARRRSLLRIMWGTMIIGTVFMFFYVPFIKDATVANEQQQPIDSRHNVQEEEDDKWHIDPSTNLRLPRQIANPISYTSAGDPFELVASGVRTVSFLSIQVYVASLYIPTTHMQRLLSTAEPSSSVQDLLKSALEQGVPMVLRVTPTRNTDFAHLRDGFARAIQSRLKYARKEPTPPTQDQEEALALSTQAFKELFPKLSLKKGENLDIVLQSAASNATKHAQPVRAAAANAVGGVDISLEHNGRVLGSVKYDDKCANLDIGKLLLQAYAADKEPVSQKFKTALQEKLLQR